MSGVQPSGFAWIEVLAPGTTTPIIRVPGPIKTARFSGYDTDVWFEAPDGRRFPKHSVLVLGPKQ